MFYFSAYIHIKIIDYRKGEMSLSSDKNTNVRSLKKSKL
jgi:hypothetical protein